MQWRKIQRSNFTSLEKLADYLEFDEKSRQSLYQHSDFILNVPERLAAKMKKNCLTDPILKQFVPLIEETKRTLGFAFDPVGDSQAQCTSSLLKKYEGRALIVATSACAMHCRYCFRKNYPYENKGKSFQAELTILRNDRSVEEVILSGGDPLSLSNESLKNLLDELSSISHIKRVRFHSRFPIGIPERIDEEFLDCLKAFSFQYWFVVHVNHPLELDEDVIKALGKIQALGIPVLNQAVLLKGVNDSEEVLEQLFRQLSNYGIFAYYLHQLDKVQGSAHFEVEHEEALKLISHLQKQLPGYAVPKYVREIQGQPSKTYIFSKV